MGGSEYMINVVCVCNPLVLRPEPVSVRVAEVGRLGVCLSRLWVATLSVNAADVQVVRELGSVERGARNLLLCVASQTDGAVGGWELCGSWSPGPSGLGHPPAVGDTALVNR